MLEKFIKYFRGDGSGLPPGFSGSYLEYLLDDIHSGVDSELSSCATHDPVLLVAMELLKKTSSKPWDGDYPCPLEDRQSTAVMAEISEASEQGDDDHTDKTSLTDTISSQNNLHIARLSDAGDDDDMIFETTQEYVVPFTDLSEETNESDINPQLEEHAIYSEEVLRAGRVWFALLIENDNLPLNAQLSVEDVLLARDLWLGHALSADDVNAKGEKLLKLVEKKFSTGLFSQARILLKLFQTDHATLINNDRNLFYEDMILRLGIRREQSIGPTSIETAQKHLLKAADSETNSDNVALGAAMNYLADHMQVVFNIHLRSKSSAELWQPTIEKSQRLHAVEEFFSYWPALKWRQPEKHGSLAHLDELLKESLSELIIKQYIISHIKACYFILRAVGDTGMESYLDGFFDWAEKEFSFDATGMMPELYKRTMANNETADVIFNDIYSRYFRAQAEQKLNIWRADENWHELIHKTAGTLAKCEIGQIAPGNYNFTGFVLDELFEFPYPEANFGFKIHRLT